MTVGERLRWVGGVAVSAVIGYAVIKAIEKDDEEEEEEVVYSDLYKGDEVDNANISPRQATMRANNIYTAMKGFGTDELAIYRAFNLINADGLRLIYNKFGIRNQENMGQWFIGELNDGEMAIVRAQWQNVGVTPPF